MGTPESLITDSGPETPPNPVELLLSRRNEIYDDIRSLQSKLSSDELMIGEKASIAYACVAAEVELEQVNSFLSELGIS